MTDCKMALSITKLMTFKITTLSMNKPKIMTISIIICSIATLNYENQYDDTWHNDTQSLTISTT